MTDIAKRATTGALVAHDHKGRGTFAEAFADIRTRRFFANGYELVGAKDIFYFIKTRRWGRGLDAYPIWLGQSISGDNLDWNTRRFTRAFLFFGGIVWRRCGIVGSHRV